MHHWVYNARLGVFLSHHYMIPWMFFLILCQPPISQAAAQIQKTLRSVNIEIFYFTSKSLNNGDGVSRANSVMTWWAASGGPRQTEGKDVLVLGCPLRLTFYSTWVRIFDSSLVSLVYYDYDFLTDLLIKGGSSGCGALCLLTSN